MPRTVTCQDCQTLITSAAPTQRYCPACSVKRDLVRKRLWARANPPSAEQAARRIDRAAASRELARQAGHAANAQRAESMGWNAGDGPDLLWTVHVAVPFSYAISKNAIYRMVPQGHVFLRREARDRRDAIAALIRAAVGQRRVAHNKVWLDILVQKPNHKGDAVNVVDTVCDAVKRAIPVDDRWFCLRRLDWQIAKTDPQLFIGIGQDSEEDAQVCSFCGLIKPFAAFGAKRGSRLGIDRVCKDCRRAGRMLAKHRPEEASCN